jgi:hypothetical protein
MYSPSGNRSALAAGFAKEASVRSPSYPSARMMRGWLIRGSLRPKFGKIGSGWGQVHTV